MKSLYLVYGLLVLVLINLGMSDSIYCNFYTKRECIRNKHKCFWAKIECKETAPVDFNGRINDYTTINNLCKESLPIDHICPSYCKYEKLRCIADMKALSELE